MRRHLTALPLLLLAAGALAGCGGGDEATGPAAAGAAAPVSAATATGEAMTEAATTEAAMTEAAMTETVAAVTEDAMTENATTEEAMTEEAAGGSALPSADLAAWQRLPVVDAETGGTFAIGDLAGVPVYVEFFATWCPNCRAQLGEAQAAAARAGADAIFVALSTETDLDAGALRSYAQENGFDDIRFAVMTPKLLAAVVDALGRDAINPPSTPHLIVAPDGTPGELRLGSAGADAIADALAAA